MKTLGLAGLLVITALAADMPNERMLDGHGTDHRTTQDLNDAIDKVRDQFEELKNQAAN